MNMRARGRRSTALAGGLGVALVLAGCGASETDGGGSGGSAEASDLTIDCAPYEEFGDLEGETGLADATRSRADHDATARQAPVQRSVVRHARMLGADAVAAPARPIRRSSARACE